MLYTRNIPSGIWCISGVLTLRLSNVMTSSIAHFQPPREVRLVSALLLYATLHARFFFRIREFASVPVSLDSLSQRPTHSGSIFRLLLKIAVGLPRSCDSRNFCRASALTKKKKNRRVCCVYIVDVASGSHVFDVDLLHGYNLTCTHGYNLSCVIGTS